ncbi:mucin-5AC-like isoform X2 [Dreissena polymorpha]|uniref:mucin-5AC-like isoform X2 n=1 Tax=Dreissena polymorpha TaxID=45954 RepID=UPI002264E167|nr:mucin-5AC-like isoform X2 [Dreissena polymorpha]
MNCRIVIDFNHVEISIVQAIGNMKVPIVGAVVLLACLATVQSLVCLNCPDAAHPRFCKHVTTCSVGEKCGIETFVSTDGDLLYKLGCVDTNFCTATPSLKSQNGNHGNQFVACQSCCDNHDLCNDVGCNSTGFPINRGPICFNCEALPGDYACHKVEHCEPHEVCFKDATLEFQTDMMYSSGCRSKHNCADNIVDPVVLLGKRHVTDDVYTENKRSVSVCTSCCAGDLCNVQCKGTGQYPPPTTTSTTLSTTLQTTVSSTMSTDTTTTTTMTWLQSTPELPPVVGMRVERGPDWHWLNQDGNGPGTVTGIPVAGWVTVRWDNNGNKNSYRYGFNNTYDVQPISATTTKITANATTTTITVNATTTTITANATTTTITANASTTTTTANATETVTARMPILQVNDTVVRGPDLMWLDQDGNGSGTVIDVPMAGWVGVRWDNTGIMNSYRYGADNKHDVQPISATTTAAATTTGPISGTTTGALSGATTEAMSGITTGPLSGTANGAISWTTTGAMSETLSGITTGALSGTTSDSISQTTTGATSQTTTGALYETTSGSIPGTTTGAMSGTKIGTMYGGTTTGATTNTSLCKPLNAPAHMHLKSEMSWFEGRTGDMAPRMMIKTGSVRLAWP